MKGEKFGKDFTSIIQTESDNYFISIDTDIIHKNFLEAFPFQFR